VIKMPKKKSRRYSGWSTRKRPFTPKEFQSSLIKKSFKGSYGAYLQSFGRQYKNKKLRTELLRK